LGGEPIIHVPTEKSKDNLKNYLDLAGVILVAINRGGNITLLNKKGYEILGYEEGELIGKSWFDVCIPKESRKELKKVFNAIINGDLEPFEYYSNPIMTKSGDKRMISWHNTLLYDDDGKITQSLSSGEDVTELKETEEKLRNQADFDKTGRIHRVTIPWSR